MASHRLEPEAFRAHVLEAIGGLSASEHLAALHAIDRGDVELDLNDEIVRVVIRDVCVLHVPVRDVS